MRHGETEPNNTFKFCFENIYGTMELTGGDNIIRSEQLNQNGSKASTKEKELQIYQMKSMCFILSSDQNRYSFLLKQLSDGDNMGRGEYPVTTTVALDILIPT